MELVRRQKERWLYQNQQWFSTYKPVNIRYLTVLDFKTVPIYFFLGLLGSTTI